MKNLHKSLYLKNLLLWPCPFSPLAERGQETDFIEKLICAGIANHCVTNRLGSLLTAAQSKSTCLKILVGQDWKINF